MRTPEEVLKSIFLNDIYNDYVSMEGNNDLVVYFKYDDIKHTVLAKVFTDEAIKADDILVIHFNQEKVTYSELRDKEGDYIETSINLPKEFVNEIYQTYQDYQNLPIVDIDNKDYFSKELIEKLMKMPTEEFDKMEKEWAKYRVECGHYTRYTDLLECKSLDGLASWQKFYDDELIINGSSLEEIIEDNIDITKNSKNTIYMSDGMQFNLQIKDGAFSITHDLENSKDFWYDPNNFNLSNMFFGEIFYRKDIRDINVEQFFIKSGYTDIFNDVKLYQNDKHNFEFQIACDIDEQYKELDTEEREL